MQYKKKMWVNKSQNDKRKPVEYIRLLNIMSIYKKMTLLIKKKNSLNYLIYINEVELMR